MLKVFLIGQHEDTIDLRDRIIEQMRERYGAKSVVFDVRARSLPEYVQQVRLQMGRCRVALVIIGPAWMRGRDAHGYRPIDNPYDPIRVEIREALARPRLVVPLLLHGATMPRFEELPPDVAPLALRQGFQVRNDPEFAGDMRTIYQQINTQLTWRSASPFVMGTSVSAGVALLASYAIAGATFRSGQQGAVGASIFTAFLLSLLIILAASTASILQSVLRRSWGWLAIVGSAIVLLVVAASLPLQGEQAQAYQVLYLFPLILLNVLVLAIFGLFGPRRETARV